MAGPRPIRRLAAAVLGVAVLTGPAMLLLGPPLPAALSVRQQLWKLVLVGGASVGMGLRARPGPTWRGLGVLVLMLAASAAVALPLSLPTIASTEGRLLAGGVGVTMALVVLSVVVVPACTGGMRPVRPGSIAWALVASMGAAAGGAGFAALVVRLWPFVQGDAWAEWLLGGLMVEAGLILATITLATRVTRPRVLLPRGLPGVLGVGLAFAAGALLLSSAIGVLAHRLGADPSELGNAPPLATDQIPGLGLALLTGAALPGVIEELFFRGVLYASLRRTQPLWLAGLVSSGVFALGHLDPTMSGAQVVVVGLRIFACGCLYAAAYQSTGSLYAPMLAHALFDSVPTVGLSLGHDAAEALGLAVLLVGYATAMVGAGFPAIRRWRARWGFLEAYLHGLLAEAGALWTVATASPAPAGERGEAVRPGA